MTLQTNNGAWSIDWDVGEKGNRLVIPENGVVVVVAVHWYRRFDWKVSDGSRLVIPENRVVVVVHRNHRSGKSATAVVKSYQKTELLLLLFLGTDG